MVPGLGFQSLLWWIMLGRFPQDAKSRMGSKKFQSLLWWIMLGRDAARDMGNKFYRLFQSLLWWIMLGRRGIQITEKWLRDCFNPSYGGSCSVGSKPRPDEKELAMFQSLLWWI